MVLFEPITGEYGEISCGWRERNRNPRTAINFDATKAPCSLVEGKGGEVKEATNLIFKLKNVSEVLARWDGAIGAIDSILPRVPSLLYSIPVQESS